MTAMPDPTATRNRRLRSAGRPAEDDRPLQTPCSLPAAISEPEKVMPPMSTSSTVARRPSAGGHASGRDRSRHGDQRGRAAADRVEQADQLRHRGHLEPSAPRTARPRRRPGSRRRARSSRAGRHRAAVRDIEQRPWRGPRRAMPAAESWLPRRAVAGEFIRCSPSTKQTAAASEANRTAVTTPSVTARPLLDGSAWAGGGTSPASGRSPGIRRRRSSRRTRPR